jgi:hypothetical protein
MPERPTYASVTTTPCTCGYLQRAADDQSLPIEFDALTGEYQFNSASSKLVIYHCPFCGGAAPKSKRHLLFAVIPSDEEQRLAQLLSHVRTIRSAIKRLGKPDRDEPDGVRTERPERDGQSPAIHHHRALYYEHLSEIADVWITERPDGTVHWSLQGKYIGPKSSRGA